MLDFKENKNETNISEGLNELNEQANQYSKDNLIKIDMHCHDYNSDKPDEILGRILNLPETWLPSEKLVKTLNNNNCEVITITNHNNARSCWELKDKGYDVLSGAEFTCQVPEFDTSIHVLAYGFSPSQEVKLYNLRKNIYKFQSYALENGIPTVWAHPLYFYSPNGIPPMEFFEKTTLIFERFEVLNGQRDTWQNLLTYEWLKTFDEQKIFELKKKYNLNLDEYVFNHNKKSYTGGSDSHMGIFPGLTGTNLYIPGISVRKYDEDITQLALQAIKEGNTFPYGGYNNNEKMTVAFLDYVCQIALNHDDPGLLRLMLHKGNYREKVTALLVANGFAELRRHKVTMNFIELFHKSFTGKVPHYSKKWLIPSVYKPIFDETKKIASSNKLEKSMRPGNIEDSIFSINKQLNVVLAQRLTKKLKKFNTEYSFDISEIMDQMEIPTEFRTYVDSSTKINSKRLSKPNTKEFLDGISFPFLASSLILAANFTATKVLYNTRPLLNKISEITGKYEHPKRMLWLTDTFGDKNGVSVVLQSIIDEVENLNLPIDFLIASNNISESNHLKVIKPVSEFELPMYASQQIRIPDFMEIHKIFQRGKYDRVMVSTEGPMGLAALYLKYAFTVEAYFYMHTDWMMFAKKALKFESPALNRLRRILRSYYRNFDRIFVLNSDNKKWLSGKHMNIKPNKISITAHWTDSEFSPTQSDKKKIFGFEQNTKVLLYAGRISKEKDVFELVDIYNKLKSQITDLKIVICGSGPEEILLKEKLPNAYFTGWVERKQLPEIYSSADLLVLPSKFDTFSMVVLEAMSCGLPVTTYNTKGPKDIIQNRKNGFVCNGKSEIIKSIKEYFSNTKLQSGMKTEAIFRASQYNSKKIIDELMKDIKF